MSWVPVLSSVFTCAVSSFFSTAGRLGGEEIRSCVTWCHKWWNEMTPKPCSDYQVSGLQPSLKKNDPVYIHTLITKVEFLQNNTLNSEDARNVFILFPL